MAIVPQPVPNTYVEGICSGYTPVSEIFTFNIDNFCNRAGVTQYQLMWLNRYGHYDYYTFTAGKDEGLRIDRQTYNQWNVDWGSNNPLKTEYSRGTTDFLIEMTEVHIINSGFVNEADMVFLEEVYTSNEVYEITENNVPRPITILNTEFTRRNKGNRTIVNLELQYAYSNNIRLLGK